MGSRSRRAWATADVSWAERGELFYKTHPEVHISGKQVWSIFQKFALVRSGQQLIDAHVANNVPDLEFALHWIQKDPEAKADFDRLNRERELTNKR